MAHEIQNIEPQESLDSVTFQDRQLILLQAMRMTWRRGRRDCEGVLATEQVVFH